MHEARARLWQPVLVSTHLGRSTHCQTHVIPIGSHEYHDEPSTPVVQQCTSTVTHSRTNCCQTTICSDTMSGRAIDISLHLQASKLHTQTNTHPSQSMLPFIFFFSTLILIFIFFSYFPPQMVFFLSSFTHN